MIKYFCHRLRNYVKEVDKMKKIATQGDICLQGDYDFVYKVAEITYTLWEDENRKQYHDLLKALCSTERKFLYSCRRAGIAQSAKKGNLCPSLSII